MAVSSEAVEMGVLPRRIAWRSLLADRWNRSLIVQACTLRNPFLVHEVNLIRRDFTFWRMSALLLVGFWLLLFQAPLIFMAFGTWALQEMFPILTLAICALQLTYRLRRPHIRYNGENAVFLCCLPIDGRQLIANQVVAVLFQPLLLMALALPLGLLVVGVGMVSLTAVAAKLAIVLALLILLATYGVARVARHWMVLIGLPIAIILTPLIGFLLVGLLGALTSEILFRLFGIPDISGEIQTVFAAIYVALAAPILLFLAAINPIWTYLMQTTPAGDLTVPGGPLSLVTAPAQTFFGAVSAGAGSAASPILTALIGFLDRAIGFILLTPVNWIVMIALNVVYLHDAWLRGADQFEFFRVRGYPERFKEFRYLELQRVRTRNLRLMSRRYFRWNERIVNRFGDGKRADLVRQVVAFVTRPFRSKQALLAMSMPPATYEARLEAEWLRRAPRSSGGRRGAAPARRTMARSSAAQVATIPAPIAMPSADIPQPMEASSTVAFPSPLPPVVGRIPPIAAQAAAQVQDAAADAFPGDDQGPIPQMFGRRIRTTPRWLRPIVAAPTRLVGWLLRVLVQLVPVPIRRNAVFLRDMRIITSIATGEREGVWSYAWTVLLLLNLGISCMIYMMVTLLQSAVELLSLAPTIAFNQQADFSFVVEAGQLFVNWLFWSLPLFFLVLPIYAYIKERSRPDWAIYALTSQTGSNMLAGKWAFLMLMGLVALVAVPIIAVVLNPMSLFGYVLYGMFPGDVDFTSWYVSPFALGLYMLAILGLGAMYYQVAQVLYFTALCFRWRRAGRASGTVGLLLFFCITTFTIIILNLSGISIIEWLDSNPSSSAVLRALGEVWMFIALHINRAFEMAVRVVGRVLPLSPWTLTGVFLTDDGPGGPGGMFDVAYVLGTSLTTALAMIAAYWSLALAGHWLSSSLFELRLRGETPRYFELIVLRRRPRKVASAVAPPPLEY